MDQGDRGDRAERRRRRGAEPLSRERILETAEQLVEQRGPSALSMRRLAEELDIAPTTIYWHVGNHDALVDGLVQRFCATLTREVPAGDTPRGRLLTMARRLRAEVSERPRLLELLLASGRLPDLYLPSVEVALTEFGSTGFSDEDIVRAVRTLLIAITGFVWSEGQLAQLHTRKPQRPGTSYTGLTLQPNLLKHAETLDTDDLFDYAIGSLLDGILGDAANGPR